ncbi:heparinase II/III-family protein [Arthrobacter sp. R1-13]
MPGSPTSQLSTPDAPVRFSAPGVRFRGPLAEAWESTAGAPDLIAHLHGFRDRMSVRPIEDQARWSELPVTRMECLVQEAEKEKRTPWPQPLVSHYARYFRDGNRTAYEDLVRARQERLTRAVVMASLTAARASCAASHASDSDPEAEAWLDEVIDGAFLLCEQSSWCWAAHDDVHGRLGHVVPDRDRPYLDLGAGEVAAQLAWLDHVLGTSLDRRAPGLRRRIRQEVQERIISPFLEQADWHWLGLDGHVHNWNPWIHSNILAVALFLVDDSELQAKTVARCIEGLDRFLAVIPADGAIDEGFSYWWNGAGRALEALALLEEATAGALAADLPVVRALVAFPHRMHIGQKWFLNVADGRALAESNLPWNMVRKWALRLGDEEAASHAEAMTATAPDGAFGLGRTLHALLERDVAAPVKAPTAPPLTAFTYLPSVQIMVARQTPGTTKGLLVTAKGGHNGENHNHKDVGSVTVAVDGVPLLVDAGQPTYTAQTFGPDRYQIRAMQSGWHSVPVPFGLEQAAGAEFGADVKQAPTVEDPRLVLELARAYGLAGGSRWTRTVSLDRRGSRVRIEDNWDLPPADASASSASLALATEGTNDVAIHFLLAGTVSLGPQGTATVLPRGIPAAEDTGGGAREILRGGILRWNQPAAVVLVDDWLLDDPLLASVWGTRLTRLRFRMPADQRSAGSFTLTMEATP